MLQTTLNKKQGTNQVWLYSFVYASRVSLIAVLVLFVSFFVQPFHQALANEVEAEALAAEVEPVAEPVKEQAVVPEEPVEVIVTETETTSEISDTETTNTTAEEPVLDKEVAIDENSVELESTDMEDPVSNDITNTDDSSSGASPTETDQSATVEPDASLDISSTTESVVSSTPATTSTASTTSGTSDSETDRGNEIATSTPTVSSSTPDIATDDIASSTISDTASTTVMDDEEVVSTTVQNDSGGSGSEDITVEDSIDTDDETLVAVDVDPVSTSVENPQAEVDIISDTETEASSTEVSVGLQASSSVAEGGVVIESSYLVTDENYYQFSRQSCVAVGDGTYHCSTDDDLGIDTQSAVYAELDEDGDMEIFMRTSKGDIEKITDNLVDDTAPQFDAESMRVVWQSLIDGRYQVMVYDLVEKEAKQLTFSRTNNMEPQVSDNGIVWQSWDNNDWEIMLFDGIYTDQLTDNETQDVTPVIEDGYVLWSILGGLEQEARVYSIESGETMTINNHEGGLIANPRFVLVYDTTFENGDIITQGFDPVTGLSKIIAAQPVSEPIEIPDTDSTGEIRALIQNKSNQKENDVVNGGPDLLPDDDIFSTNKATSSDILDLKQSTTDDVEVATVATSTAEVIDFELTDFDLVITDKAVSTTSVLNTLETIDIDDSIASSTQS